MAVIVSLQGSVVPFLSCCRYCPPEPVAWIKRDLVPQCNGKRPNPGHKSQEHRQYEGHLHKRIAVVGAEVE